MFAGSVYQCIWQLFLFCCLCLGATAYAATPEQIPGATRVSAEQFIELVGAYPDMVVIDARITANRKHGYIEGSASLPDTKTNCDSLAELIPAADTPAAFYCNGVKCGRSVKSVKIALSCGYTKVYWFRGGFEEWKGKNYPYLRF